MCGAGNDLKPSSVPFCCLLSWKMIKDILGQKKKKKSLQICVAFPFP